MKKKHIYREFTGLAKFYTNNANRNAVKMYEYKICEKLGTIDHKKSFVLYCSKKRVEIIQPTQENATSLLEMAKELTAKGSDNGSFLFFAKDAEEYQIVEADAVIQSIEKFIQDYTDNQK